jgi:predicted O-linked N-acetylglucosamine transferase (SPINDLY family)
VAHDSDEYVGIACELANAHDRLRELQATLRARVETSALTDGNACARSLHAVWREAWTEWCRRTAKSVR